MPFYFGVVASLCVAVSPTFFFHDLTNFACDFLLCEKRGCRKAWSLVLTAFALIHFFKLASPYQRFCLQKGLLILIKKHCKRRKKRRRYT